MLDATKLSTSNELFPDAKELILAPVCLVKDEVSATDCGAAEKMLEIPGMENVSTFFVKAIAAS